MVAIFKSILVSSVLLTSVNTLASEGSLGSQLVNLNLHIKSKHTNSKSSLAMPFYQTAELERFQP